MRLGAVDARRRAHRRRPAHARAAGRAAPRAHAARGRAAAASARRARSLAALAGERDILRGEPRVRRRRRRSPAGPSDLLLRADLFAEAARRGFSAGACRALGLDPRAVRAVERARRQLARGVRRRATPLPDRAAALRARRVPRPRLPPPRAGLRPRRHGGRHRRRARRRRASCARPSCSSPSTSRAAGGGPRRVVRVASAVGASGSRRSSPARSRPSATLRLRRARAAVVERRRERYDDLVLAETIRADVDRAAPARCWPTRCRATRRCWRDSPRDEARLARPPALPRAAMPECGAPLDPLRPRSPTPCAPAPRAGAASRSCARRPGRGAPRPADPPAARGARARRTDACASRAAARRRSPTRRTGRPSVAARIQELFGLLATPRLAGGRVPVVLQLLAPNQRPVQVTDDLASFWRTTYFEVRKQLRGRYPKHAWPDDPTTARPPGRRIPAGR